ncbi:MAG: M60 family metallopeptidase [Marinifilaceae bacterium]
MREYTKLYALLCNVGLLLNILTVTSCSLTSVRNDDEVGKPGIVPVYFAKGTQCQPGSELGNAVDGSLNTLYHSQYTATSLPDTLYFEFVDIMRLDSMIYYPRTSQSNGLFGETEIWYASSNKPDKFIKVTDMDYLMSPSVTALALNGSEGIKNPVAVKIIVKTGYANLASCAEMVFTGVAKKVADETNPAAIARRDVKVAVASGKSSNAQRGEDIDKSFDGDISTLYHSQWSSGGFPIQLDYFFENVDKIDYLIYHPRMSNPNGLFQEVEIEYAQSQAPSKFIKIGNYNFKASSSATKILFPTALEKPAVIRFVLKNGNNNYASCAEMEFYVSSDNLTNYPQTIFTNACCNELASGVTTSGIKSIESDFYRVLAQSIRDKSYDVQSRIRSYKPYPLVASSLAKSMTNGLSFLENPTGIVVDSASQLIVFVEDTFGQNISISVHDTDKWKSSTYSLETGVNKIQVNTGGLIYVNYYNDLYKTLQPVKIHICGGEVNGVYELGVTTADEYKQLLVKAKAPKLDIVGKKTHLVYPIVGLKNNSPYDAKELIELYDSVVSIQYQMLGLYKYQRAPLNHMLCIGSNVNGGWYGGGYAHFGFGFENTCSAANAKENIWGIAHEIGHVNTGSFMRVVSTTEVMNNVFSVWTQYLFSSSTNKKLEHEHLTDAYSSGTKEGKGAYGNEVIGGRFNAYLNSGILHGNRWLCQYGADAMGKPEKDWQFGNTDHFVKLCPLWQLVLYYQQVQPENKDWYADISEIARKQNEQDNGQKLLNLMTNICDVVQEDLTDFFRKCGMLRTFNKYMEDYGPGQLTITAADSAQLVNYIASKKYPKPKSPVIYYLSANSVHAFKNKLKPEGTPQHGCTPFLTFTESYKRYVLVDHEVWKNVAVFETYNNKNLIRLSMVGTDDVNNKTSRVYYPIDATAIYAVGYDGIRHLVYGEGTERMER